MAARLGETNDPKALVPGEPELISGDLRQLVRTLRQVLAAGEELGGIDAGDWSGAASGAFRDAFRTGPPRWRRAGEDLGGGGLLADYADTLVESQREAQRAVELYLEARAATRLAAARHDALVLSGATTAPFQDPGQAGTAAAQQVLDAARHRLAGIGDVVAERLGWESDGNGGYGKTLGEKEFGAKERESSSGSQSKRLLTDVIGEVAEGIGIDVRESEWTRSAEVAFKQGELSGDFTAGSMTGSGRADGTFLAAEAGVTATSGALGVAVGAHAGAYVAQGHAEGEIKLGQHAGVSGSAEGSIGAAGEAKGSIGLLGAKGSAEAFAGAKVSGEAAAEVAGVSAGVNGEAWAGVGAQASGQFGMGEDGKFHVGGSIGLALGVGGKVGFDISVDPAAVAEAVSDVADDIGEIAHDVGEAAHDVGEGVAKAGRAVAKLFGL